MVNVRSFSCTAFQRPLALHFFILLQNRDRKHSATFRSIPIQKCCSLPSLDTVLAWLCEWLDRQSGAQMRSHMINVSWYFLPFLYIILNHYNLYMFFSICLSQHNLMINGSKHRTETFPLCFSLHTFLFFWCNDLCI